MALRQGGGVGVVSKPGSPAPSSTTDEKISKFPTRKITLQVATGETIDVGDSVSFDLAQDPLCRAVQQTDVDDSHDHLVVGLYSDASGRGTGGTGAETSRSGMSGMKGQAGDLIEIVVSGPAYGWVGDDASTDIDVGDILIPDANAGELTIAATEEPADEAAMARHTYVALEAQASATAAKKLVLVNSGF